MKSFITTDENIFRGQGRLPGNFLAGLALNALYVVILWFTGLLLFTRSLYRIDEKKLTSLGGDDIEIDNDKNSIWLIQGETFKDFFYNILSGKTKGLFNKGFTGKVLIEGTAVEEARGPHDFLYICRPQDIPGDIEVRDFIRCAAGLYNLPINIAKSILDTPPLKAMAAQTFDRLKQQEQFNVMMTLIEMKKRDIYLVNDIATGLPVECAIALEDKKMELIDKGSLLIYLTSTPEIPRIRPMEGECFRNCYDWHYHLKANRKALELEKEKKAREQADKNE